MNSARCGIALSVSVAVVIAVASLLQPVHAEGHIVSFEPSASSVTAAPRSAIQRLNQYRQQQPKLYLPNRLLIGEQQTITIQGPPNRVVRVFLSPQGRGFTTDDGLALHVSEQVQTLEGQTNANGVAKIVIDLPNNPNMDGERLYMDGVIMGTGDEVSQQLHWMDSTGRETTSNRLVMMVPADSMGATVLPGLPGLGGDMMRRLGTFQDVRKGGERLKTLVDDGSRSTDNVYDRNIFLARPDGSGGVGN